MGLLSVAQEGRQVVSSGRGRGTRPSLGIETEMGGLGLGERRNSAGHLGEGGSCACSADVLPLSLSWGGSL